MNYLKLYLLSVSLVLFEVGFGAFLEHFIDLRHDPLYSYKRLLTVILPKKGSGARKIGSFASSWRINATASPLGFLVSVGTALAPYRAQTLASSVEWGRNRVSTERSSSPALAKSHVLWFFGTGCLYKPMSRYVTRSLITANSRFLSKEKQSSYAFFWTAYLFY